ncbi:MAG TPA: ABC transporter substrate-binding protein [Nocardioidaceae bacterium]|nr:ABC transporter substrate-binding protein [Nocardioidaceae bacterium]
MPRRRKLITAMLALPLVAAVACTGEPATETSADPQGQQSFADNRPARQGGEVTVALAEEPDALDPSLARTFVGRIVFANMCEKLYDTDANLELVPQLAADMPDISADGTTVTIPIRRGVRFNDGTQLDAAAVKTSIERHQNITGSARTAELAPVQSVEVVDPMTVRLNLSQPFAPLTAILADRAGMIMSPAQLRKSGANFGDNPVCVGPFEFAERRAGDAIVLDRSNDYYDADQVNLDRVTFSIIEQGPVRAANLRSGEVDIAERLDTTSLEDIEAEQGLRLYEATSIGYQGITVNVGNTNGVEQPFGQRQAPIASDPRVRRAFELSLDREAINDVVFNGRYEPSCSPIAPNSKFAPEIDCGERDVEQAKSLLQEAGVQTPVPVELMLATDQTAVRLGQVVQEMAKEAGFAVNARPTEFVSSLDLADQGNFDTFQIGWSGRVDPDGNIYDFHHSEGALNYSGAHDPEVDRMLEQARTTIDTEERRQLYADIIDAVRERANIIYLYHENLFTGASSDIVGLQYHGDGLLRLKTAGLAAN